MFMRICRCVGLVLIAGICSSCVLEARASILYALADFDNTTGTLVTIDTSDGSTSVVGVTSVERGYGLADYNGRLFSYDQSRDLIVEINPTDGAEIGVQNFGRGLIGEGGIALDGTGTGYVADTQLYRFVLGTDGSSDVGTVSDHMDGLDFQPGTDVLFGLSQATSASAGGSLFTINTATAATTEVGALGNIDQGAVAGLTFDGAGVLYAITEVGRLFEIDPSSGAASLLWETGLSGVSGLSYVATREAVIPEPASAAIWTLLGLVAGLRFSRKRRQNT